MPTNIHADLEDWNDLKPEMLHRPNLLLGNGASVAIWRGFSYTSLFEEACRTGKGNHLSVEDIQLFQKMGDTKNFEKVLSGLATAKIVNEILGNDTDEIMERYESIRLGLIQAVRDIHVPHDKLTSRLEGLIQSEFRQYRNVFTTNYDLSYYWCYVTDEHPCKDFFWGAKNSFDISDCTNWDETTGVYYLHGALHLYKTPDGQTIKITSSDEDGSLLDQFDSTSMKIPLFISEGTSEDKMSAILRNEYLSFAYREFSRSRRNLDVFGQSLSPEFDSHLIAAIKRMKKYSWRDLTVAISVYVAPNTTDHDIIQFKVRLLQALPGKVVRFFDSKTHPLGNADLLIS